MTFVAAATSGNTTHLIADSLLTPSQTSNVRKPLLSTGLLIGLVTKKTHKEVLKIANWNQLAMGVAGDWHLGDEALRLINKRLLDMGRLDSTRLPHFLSEVSMELDIKKPSFLRALGFKSSVEGDRRFRMNFLTNEFEWIDDPRHIATIGTGGKYFERIETRLKKTLEATSDPVKQHVSITDGFLNAQIAQLHQFTSDMLIGGAPYGVFSFGGKIYWMPPRTLCVYILKKPDVFDPNVNRFPDFVMRIAYIDDSVVSFTAPLGAVVARSNALTPQFNWNDEKWRREILTLNAQYFSVVLLQPNLHPASRGSFFGKVPDGEHLFDEKLELKERMPTNPKQEERFDRVEFGFRPSEFLNATILAFLSSDADEFRASQVDAAKRSLEQYGAQGWLEHPKTRT
jgi:hypothetical protein